MVWCSVSGCRGKALEGGGGMVRYFRFPKDESTRLKWIQRCGRRDKVSSFGRLCDRHFSPQQYARDLQNELLGIPAPRNKRLLKPEAIPDLHLPHGIQASSSKCDSSTGNHIDQQLPQVIEGNSESNSQVSRLESIHNEHDYYSSIPLVIQQETSNSEDTSNLQGIDVIAKVTEMEDTMNGMLPETSPVCAASINNDGLSEGKYECSLCSKRFSRRNLFETHLDVHDGKKGYECSICGKRFAYKSHITVHMVVHTGEKKHECATCEKRFTCKSNLKSHMLLHTGEKKYECDICSRRFTHKSNFNSHMAAHTECEKYECHICNKIFNNKGTLRYHMDIHSGEKRYECGLCNKKFTQKGNLKSHLSVHSGEKKFKCNICNKSYTREGSLRRHTNAHVNIYKKERSYHCHVCNDKFKSESLLRRHGLIHDKDEKCEIPFEYVEIPSGKKEPVEWNNCDMPQKLDNEMCDENLSSANELEMEDIEIKEECKLETPLLVSHDENQKSETPLDYGDVPTSVKKETDDWICNGTPEKRPDDVCVGKDLSGTVNLET